MHTLDSYGDTPLQSWCRDDEIHCAGIVMLLEAGADLCMPHPQGQTALWHLCSNKRLMLLQKLAAAGWLQNAELSAPLAHARELLAAMPGAQEQREVVELLSAQQQLWPEIIRPAVIATLTAHDQLVPELAELIVSYLDVDQRKPAAAAAAAQP